MPDVYSGITLTDEEVSSLSEVEDKQPISTSDSSTESLKEEEKTVDTDSFKSFEAKDDSREKSETEKESPNPELSEEQYDIQIGEDVFDLDNVLEWKKDFDNKKDWNKSNTQKAQSIARGGRILELLDNDDNFRDHMKEYFYGDDKEVKKYGLDKEFGIDFEKVPEPQPQQQQQQQQRDPRERRVDPLIGQMYDRVVALEDEKLGRSIGDRYDDIKTDNPDFFKADGDGVDFLNYCNDSGVIVNNDIDMEASFKLWSYDKVMTAENRKEQLYNNKLRNEGSTIGNSEIGAKEVRSGDSPKNYKEISMDNPEVSRYFNT